MAEAACGAVDLAVVAFADVEQNAATFAAFCLAVVFAFFDRVDAARLPTTLAAASSRDSAGYCLSRVGLYVEAS